MVEEIDIEQKWNSAYFYWRFCSFYTANSIKIYTYIQNIVKRNLWEKKASDKARIQDKALNILLICIILILFSFAHSRLESVISMKIKSGELTKKTLNA